MGDDVSKATGGGALVWIWGMRFWGMGWVGSCTIRVVVVADWRSCDVGGCGCTGVTRARREGTLMPDGRLDCGTGSRVCKLGGNRLVVVVDADVVCTRASGVCCMRDIWKCGRNIFA